MLKHSRILVLLTVVLGLAAGEGSKEFVSADGSQRITYAERLPTKPAAARLGLILLFHGGTLNETSLIPTTMGALEQAGIANHHVVIGLKSKGSGWNDVDDAPVIAFLTHALTAYPVDSRRVIGMGYSAGCYYITRLAQRRPDLFAGGIGYVGSQSGGPASGDPTGKGDLYWVTGHRDTLQPYKEARAVALRNLAAGLPVIYREEREMAHDFLWGRSGADALVWMQTLRVKEATVGGDDAAFLADFADEKKAKKLLADARSWNRVVDIAGPPVLPVVLQGLQNEKAAVQSNAAIACTRIQIDDAITAELGRLLLGKDKKLKGLALTALMTHAMWNRPAAQQVLCRVVLDHEAAAGDRRAVAQSLIEVAKLDLAGAQVYTRIVWTLVDLLDDEDAALRQTAFMALEPAMTGGFGYQPGANKTGRSSALEQWRGWAEKQCGPRPTP